MMMGAKCDYCHGPLFWKFGDKGYSITETLYDEPCKKCGQARHKKTTYSFCKWDCLRNWVNEKRGRAQ